ncbi:hypothetical protein MNBD_IGNAVI01-3094 [hydrothermal vent metagenome]|uniref:Uncharacterized protein n=1 Tax=hydrothermal vent metagenome TaxID=652676 RepID=A0A3B1C2Y2_9ZZZZ
MFSLRILVSQKSRIILTILGMSLCISLMLFLAGIYKGVADGSVEYIRHNDADLWILQKSSNNILRGTSILPYILTNKIVEQKEVESVSPVLLLLTTVKRRNNFATLFLAGYPKGNKYGGPPEIVEGKNVENDNEIVLDKAFASKMRYKIGDSVRVQDSKLLLVGLSSGTNAFVIQYGFTTLKRASKLLGFPGIVTTFIVKLKPNSNRSDAAEKLKTALPNTSIFDQGTFLKNNITETESGILPIFYSIAGLGGIVLTVILSLILSINILEKRKDMAVMKAMGAPKYFLPMLVLNQAMIISAVSIIISLFIYFPMVNLIEMVSPEVSAKITVYQVILISILIMIMSLISSMISINKLRNIYPLEVFQ